MFNTKPLSDSPSKAERPWYGLDRDSHIGGYRRQYLPKPGEPGGGPPFDLEMWMSDNFTMTIPKFETLADGSAGPNFLTRIYRDQWFQLWLAAIEISKVNDLASYKRLMEVEWGYKIDSSVILEGDNADLRVSVDSPWHTVKFGDFMDPIPAGALNAPVANENQELDYYLGGVFKHVIERRKD